MKTEQEIREMIARYDKYLDHHGGPFGEGVESQDGVRAGLKWVLDEFATDDLDPDR